MAAAQCSPGRGAGPLRWLGRLVALLVLLPLAAWGAGILAFHGSHPVEMVTGWALVIAVSLFGAWRSGLSRLLPLALATAALGLWWISLQPREERDWDPRVARLPVVTVEGDRYHVANLRQFRWGPEPAGAEGERIELERWGEATYDLSRLQGLDLYLSYWTGPSIAHAIVSARFAEGPPLAFSIEIRRERGEAYSALAGFFKRYELIIIAAEEQDVVRLRTHVWREDVRLYPLTIGVENARAVLLGYADEINALAARPSWYDTLKANCTTIAFRIARRVWPDLQPDWRVVLSGHAPELARELGAIRTDLPLEEVKRRAAVTERARDLANDETFPAALRALVETP
jgi:hypothetical protein